MEQIFLPTSIDFLEGDRPHVGKIVMTPCRQGYGTTIGNALRRVLLSSLPGAAVETIKIDGVAHEFAAIEGVLEDVIQVILNVKQMSVIVHAEDTVTLSLKKKGVGPVTAGDFAKNSDVEIVNPDLVLMNITDAKATINMEITVGKGRGFVPAAEKNTKDLPLGTIAIDSLYTPIRDVGYDVELTRVGDITDYERLTVTIETNGTIAPKESIAQATQILMDHFSLLLNEAGREG
jgi:DNA-directed RNA polymerase subunit alpha